GGRRLGDNFKDAMTADLSGAIIHNPTSGRDHLVDDAAAKIAEGDAANHFALFISKRLNCGGRSNCDDSEAGLGFRGAIGWGDAEVRSALVSGRRRPICWQRHVEGTVAI